MAPLGVLLVDDESSIREMLKAAFSLETEFDVIGEADTGRAAIDVALQLKPDVIILDQMMPEMAGTEALPAIRENLGDAVVIMLTALDAERIRDEAMAAGANAVFNKTIGPLALVREVHSLTDGRTTAEDS